MTGTELVAVDPDDFLAHYGVKGMRWGKSSKKSTSDDSESDDHKAVASVRKKKPSQMSNDELKKLNERLNLEQNYARLNPGVTAKGKKIAAGLIGSIGTGVTLYNYYNGNAGKAARKKMADTKVQYSNKVNNIRPISA